MKDFDRWNLHKKRIDARPEGRHYKEREIYYLNIGENVGFEQNGKGEEFVRPVVVLKRFNRHVFIGIPLSSTQKRGKFYFPFSFVEGKESVAILSQLRIFDAKRLLNKLGMMKKDDFVKMKEEIKNLLEL